MGESECLPMVPTHRVVIAQDVSGQPRHRLAAGIVYRQHGVLVIAPIRRRHPHLHAHLGGDSEFVHPLGDATHEVTRGTRHIKPIPVGGKGTHISYITYQIKVHNVKLTCT
jgi:hypothetical protein